MLMMMVTSSPHDSTHPRGGSTVHHCRDGGTRERRRRKGKGGQRGVPPRGLLNETVIIGVCISPRLLRDETLPHSPSLLQGSDLVHTVTKALLICGLSVHLRGRLDRLSLSHRIRAVRGVQRRGHHRGDGDGSRGASSSRLGWVITL